MAHVLPCQSLSAISIERNQSVFREKDNIQVDSLVGTLMMLNVKIMTRMLIRSCEGSMIVRER